MKGEVHWQCSCSVWHEELTLGSEINSYIDTRPKVLAAGFPDLSSLSTMLCYYNSRELTYDEDALAAITGLLTALSRTFEGGFLYGLPEMMIDCALAWQPQWPSTNMRRRQTTGRPSRINFAATDLPSWSWVAWQGMFNHRHGEANRINWSLRYIEETTPITEWYTSSTPSGKPRRKIQSTWFEKRESRKDVNAALPEGWTRLAAPEIGDDALLYPSGDDALLYPDGCGKFVYQHHGMPDKQCDTWYYPFDVPEVDESTPGNMPEQTRYLFCKTWKVSMWSHRTIDTRFGDNHVLTLRNGPHEPDIGKLHLQTDEQLESWPAPVANDASPGGRDTGKTIDLVAINQCVHYAKTFNEDRRCYGPPLKREERMSVLWVEWEHGVAHRLACGWVEKGAWDSLAQEEVDLILG